MDPVNDLMILRSTEVERLEKEVKDLKFGKIMLKLVVGLLTILAIFNIWWYKNLGYIQGYEDAVKDFYKGTSLKCDMIDEKIVWKK